MLVNLYFNSIAIEFENHYGINIYNSISIAFDIAIDCCF